MNFRFPATPVILLVGVLSGHAAADDETSPAPTAAQANNPLANITAFNIQNYYIGELTDSDENANQFWFRYARPFSVGEATGCCVRPFRSTASRPCLTGN